MSRNGTEPATLDELLERAYADVKTLYVQAQERTEALRSELETAKAEESRLRQILTTAGVIEKRPWGKSAAPKKNKNMSDERYQRYLKNIQDFISVGAPVIPDVAGSFTASAVMHAFPDLDRSGLDFAIVRAREGGVIRACGKVKRPDGKGAAMTAYAFTE